MGFKGAWLVVLALGLCSVWADSGLDNIYEHNDPYDMQNHTHREQCWERCFQVENTEWERFREVYDDFYRMGMEARRLKNIYGVNGTVLLLDSTLSAFHANNAFLDYEDYGPEIFKYQRHLAAMVAIMMGSNNDFNPFYIIQFDENYAYSCKEFGCLDACEAMKILTGMGETTGHDDPHSTANEASDFPSQLDALQMGETSHYDGNIEAACAMGKSYITSTTCGATCANEMAIGILNSDIYTTAHKDRRREDWEHGKGPCYAHFETRMPIGTHAAGWDELEKWGSTAARAFYMYDNEFTMKAASEMIECMQIRCCPTMNHANTAPVSWWNTAIMGNQCERTEGRFGQEINTWSDHDHYGP